jgi:hypothetical protein
MYKPASTMKAPTVLIASTYNIPRTVVACLASVFDTTIGFSGGSVRFSTMTNTTLVRHPTRWRTRKVSQNRLVAAFRSDERRDNHRGGCQTRSTGTANTHPMPRCVWMTRGTLGSRSSLRRRRRICTSMLRSKTSSCTRVACSRCSRLSGR